MGPKEHWQRVYATRAATQVGWYEADPAVSRRLLAPVIARSATSVIDIGGGASSLVDHLLDLGVGRLAVLDITEGGLEVARRRLGARAERVTWIVGDVTGLQDVGRYDVWHDRAAYHFLLDPEDRRRYRALAERTVPAGGTAMLATFAPDGPERCSGLPVRRYDAEALAEEWGDAWRLTGSERHLHTTPAGVPQQYLYTTFQRSNATS
jgi:hypothetical protein